MRGSFHKDDEGDVPLQVAHESSFSYFKEISSLSYMLLKVIF